MEAAGTLTLRALAPAKINLCLFLGPVRDDGRHQLLTVFESQSLADSVTLTTLAEGDCDDVVCPGVEGPNLAEAALAALRDRGWPGPPVRIEIEKRIPVAGGMAGGSADAAAVLRLASELAPGRPEEIAAIAAGLGSDVPSQVVGGLVLGGGAGDEVEPLPALAAHAWVVVPSAVRLSTADVYAEADRLGLAREVQALADLETRLDVAFRPGSLPPAEYLNNDLQAAAVSLCPSIADALDAVRAVGADQALVCGSGPTVAGLLWGDDGRDRAKVAAVRLRSSYPAATAAAPVPAGFGWPVLVRVR